MDFISSAFKILFDHNLPPNEKIKAKEKIFLIDDSIKVNKLSYAYFLDRFKAHTKKEIEERNSLARHQWFAGSLTAEQFAESLNQFLNSPESSNLSPTLKQNVQAFAAALQNSKTQGYLIDLIRSNDLKLIYLILTGKFIGGQIEAKPEEIQALSQETLKQLREMKEGDNRIFLLGNLIHETRMMIEKQNQGWEISYFDSAQPQYKLYKSKEQSPILDSLFWDKIYTFKFLPDSQKDLEKHLETNFQNDEVKEIPKTSKMKPQEKNTCHFKGLLAALKKACLSDPAQNPEESQTDWKAFKIAYGDFLLKNPKLNDQIKIMSYKQQEIREDKVEQRNRFIDLIKQGKYEDTVKDYLSALAILGCYDKKLLRNSSPLEILQYLDQSFSFNLKPHLFHLSEIEPKLRELNQPCLNFSLDIFKTSMEKARTSIAGELKSELNASRSNLGLIVENLLKVGRGSQDFSTSSLDFLSFDIAFSNFKPLSREEVIQWLDTMYREPQLLTHLQQRPIFVSLLIESIYLGEVKKVRELFDQLKSEDQQLILHALDTFNMNDYFSPKFLPAFESMPHPLDEKLFELLLKKALLTSSLKDLYLILKQKPIYIWGYSAERFKPSKEQILEFFAIITEENFNRLEEEYGSIFGSDLFYHIAISGWNDILEKTPPFLLDKMIQICRKKMTLELTNDQLQQLELFLKLQTKTSITEVFKDSVIMSQYKLKMFDKLLENKQINPSENTAYSQYYVKVNKEDINPILQVLTKSESQNLSSFLLNNLMQDFKTHDKKTMTHIIKFAAERKKEALMNWLEKLENDPSLFFQDTRSTPFFDDGLRLKILETIIENSQSFDEEILSKAVNVNLSFLVTWAFNEAQFNKMEELLAKTDISKIQFNPKLLGNLSKEVIDKYPYSILVKQAKQIKEKA